MPASRDLFDALARAALQRALREGQLPNRPPAVATPWQLLVAGIWIVRSAPRSDIRKIFWGWRRRVPGLSDVVRILSRARDRTTPRSFSPQRTSKEIRRINTLVRELYDVLDALYTQAQDVDTHVCPFVSLGNDACPHAPEPLNHHDVDDGGAQSPPNGWSPGEALASDWLQLWEKAQESQPCPPISLDTAADEHRDTSNADTPGQEADVYAGSIDDLSSDTQEDAGRAISLDWKDEELLDIEFNEEMYERVRSVFAVTARNLTSIPTIRFENGHRSGLRITQPHRALIDGRVFRRTSFEDVPAAAVAMLMDHSHSMHSDLAKLLPVSAGMTDALHALPDVNVAYWRFGSRVERIEHLRKLREIKLMGSTATHEALEAAIHWLQPQPAELKMVMLFTDGEPDDGRSTTQQILQLRRLGIRFLIGANRLQLGTCAQAFPSAILFDARPEVVASALQTVLRRFWR
jgi:hypothetical protein